MNSTAVLAVDVDECLSDTYPLMIRVGEELGYRLHPTTEYHPRAWFDVEGSELAEIQELIDTRLHQAAPVAGAQEAIEDLRHRFELVALTGRTAGRHGAATEEFLQRNFPGMFSRVLYADQEGMDLSKGELARRIGAVALIDDLPVYVRDVADHGLPVVHLNRGQTWQSVVEHPLVRSAESWQQVPGLLTGLLA